VDHHPTVRGGCGDYGLPPPPLIVRRDIKTLNLWVRRFFCPPPSPSDALKQILLLTVSQKTFWHDDCKTLPANSLISLHKALHKRFRTIVAQSLPQGGALFLTMPLFGAARFAKKKLSCFIVLTFGYVMTIQGAITSWDKKKSSS
jgi:hypothetical protein